jgi:hypothetical protein
MAFWTEIKPRVVKGQGTESGYGTLYPPVEND